MKKTIFTLLGWLFVAAFSLHAQDKDSTKIEASIFFKEGKFHIQSKDKAFRLSFDNRVFLDGAIYQPVSDISNLVSKENEDIALVTEGRDDAKFRFSNGLILRRARLAFKVELYKKWFGEFDVDFAYNLVEVEDMFVGYQFNDKFSVKVGHFKEPLSMERVTSSRNLMGMERPMVVQAFCNGRRLGIGGTGWGKHWWASAGFFGQEASSLLKEKNRGNDGWGVAGRLALSPIAKKRTTLHIGGSAHYRTPDSWGNDNSRMVEFRALPESYVDRRRFIRDEITNVDHYITTGIEFAFRHEKFLVNGEYLFTNLARTINGTKMKNSEFNGWYASASYMILGKARVYDPAEAEFKNGETRAKTGNLEVFVRVSTLNLNDYHNASAPIRGGEAWCYTGGINWYPNRNVLIGFNYIYTDNDKYANDRRIGVGKTTDTTIKANALSEGIDFGTWQMRAMLSF
jgi:phosphate-selective porin